MLTHPGLVNQMWVDSTRAINYTMFKDAIAPADVDLPGRRQGGVRLRPATVTSSDDFNGMGTGNAPTVPGELHRRQRPRVASPTYAVTRMKFFTDLNKYADQPLDALRVRDVAANPVAARRSYDSVVLAENARSPSRATTRPGRPRCAPSSRAAAT